MAISKITSDAIDATNFNLDSDTLTIDATNNRVGVGTTSPGTKLHIADNTDINMSNDASGQFRIEGNGYSAAIALNATGMQIYQNSSARSIIFGNNETEQMRINSSGAIKFGNSLRTSIGSAYFADDAANGNNGGFSIGGGPILNPTDGNGNATDNAMDLGGASSRWNDLYLGGGAYIGGTSSANKLDDYEEGTWTPQVIRFDGSIAATISVSGGTATYVKIGRLVTIKAWINSIVNGSANGSSYWTITGLPFTGSQYSTVAKGYGSISPNGYYIGDANGQILLTLNSVPYTGSLSGTLMVTITYETDS